MSETLQQLTYRLTGAASVGHLPPQPSFEDSLGDPYFPMTCELVRLAVEHERQRCKTLAQDWVDDPCPTLTIGEYIDAEGVCNEPS